MLELRVIRATTPPPNNTTRFVNTPCVKYEEWNSMIYKTATPPSGTENFPSEPFYLDDGQEGRLGLVIFALRSLCLGAEPPSKGVACQLALMLPHGASPLTATLHDTPQGHCYIACARPRISPPSRGVHGRPSTGCRSPGATPAAGSGCGTQWPRVAAPVWSGVRRTAVAGGERRWRPRSGAGGVRVTPTPTPGTVSCAPGLWAGPPAARAAGWGGVARPQARCWRSTRSTGLSGPSTRSRRARRSRLGPAQARSRRSTRSTGLQPALARAARAAGAPGAARRC